MPKKKKEEEQEDHISFIKDTLKNMAQNLAKGIASTWLENIKEKIREGIMKAKRRMFGSALVMIGLVFALVGFAIFLNEIIDLSNGLGYAIVGIIVLLIGYLMIKGTEND